MENETHGYGFRWKIIRSSRKTLSLEVRRDGTVVVRAPQTLSDRKIQRFVEEKTPWVLKNLDKADRRRERINPYRDMSQEEKDNCRRAAGQVFRERTDYFAGKLGVTYGKITIREQKTRWGSCSSIGNLNFNWKLMLAPPRVLDYVVIHELCHRKEMNHSSAFWEEVAKAMPDYLQQKKWLKENGWMLSEL